MILKFNRSRSISERNRLVTIRNSNFTDRTVIPNMKIFVSGYAFIDLHVSWRDLLRICRISARMVFRSPLVSGVFEPYLLCASHSDSSYIRCLIANLSVSLRSENLLEPISISDLIATLCQNIIFIFNQHPILLFNLIDQFLKLTPRKNFCCKQGL